MRKIFLALITLVIITAFASCGGIDTTKEITTQDYVTVVYDGNSGYATASITVDEATLMQEFDQQKLSETFESLMGIPSSESVDVFDFFEYKFANEYTNLSNGDTVDVVVVVSEQLSEQGKTLDDIKQLLNVTFTEESITFTVDGLDETPIFDIFAYVDDYIVFKGANGNGVVDVRFPEDFEFVYGDFKLEAVADNYSRLALSYLGEVLGEISYGEYGGYSRTLSNGDVVMMEALGYNYTNIKGKIENLGHVVPTMKKEYTVSGLGTYYISDDQLTREYKEQMVTCLNEKIALLLTNRTSAFGPIEYEYEISDSYYIATPNPGTSTNDEKLLVCVCRVNSGNMTMYNEYWLKDIVLYPDGTVSGELDGGGSIHAKSLSEAVSKASIYNYTLINIENVKK